MNILFVTPYPPSRIRVRPFELLRALAKRQHKVTLATIWATPEDRQDIDMLRGAGIEVVEFYLPRARSLTNALLALPTSTPLQAVYCWHPHFADLLVELATNRQTQVIHVEHLRAARYGLYVQQKLKAARHPIPIVWDSVDCITHLFRQAASQSRSQQGRLLSKLELARTGRYEGWLVDQFDRTLVTSAADCQALEHLAGNTGGHAGVQILPNGVDTAYFALPDQARRPATLILSGKMSYHANITAAQYLVKEIMPLVWAERPDVDLWIVGKDPTRAVSELAQIDGPGSGKIEVFGTVPEMRSFLGQATIAVAPLVYGAGIQNKVLEAMACGTPVVASPQAVSALQTKAGEELMVGRTPQEFATTILTLLASPLEQARLSQAGRAFVQEHHAWSASADHLERIYAAASN